MIQEVDWDDISNQRSFMDNLSKKLSINDPIKWYKITMSAIQAHGGEPLLQKYDHSLGKLISSVYSEYTWDTTKFASSIPSRRYWDELSNQRNVPHGHWNQLDNQQSFMDDIEMKLQVTKPEDWFQLTSAMIQQYGGGGLLSIKYNSIPKLLSALRPEYKTACRNFVLRIVKEFNLSKVEDILHLPLEYPPLSSHAYRIDSSNLVTRSCFDNTGTRLVNVCISAQCV